MKRSTSGSSKAYFFLGLYGLNKTFLFLCRKVEIKISLRKNTLCSARKSLIIKVSLPKLFISFAAPCELVGFKKKQNKLHGNKF